MHPSSTTRRGFLAGIAGAAGLFAEDVNLPPGITLRIAPVKLEVAPGRFVDTIGYNGSVPGPLIRFRENETVTIDIFNDTDAPEFVHWHGFDVSTDVDGAEEEGSPAVAAHGRVQYRLTPVPAGFRYVHTHAMSMANLSRGTFT
jgi:FtsP/CotA-like multicopper oxidase with cupredoxin domain